MCYDCYDPACETGLGWSALSGILDQLLRITRHDDDLNEVRYKLGLVLSEHGYTKY